MAAGVKVNRNALISVVTKGMANKAHSAAVRTVAQVMSETKAFALEAFNEHPVTQEIEAGPAAESSSGALGGYKTKNGESGNLWSFIGFSKTRVSPTIGIRNMLLQMSASSMYANKGANKRRVDEKRGIVTMTFNATLPTQEKLEMIAAADTPSRISQRSWVHGIENGFDNLHYYLFRRKGFGMGSNSYSGTGLQVKNKTASASFKPTKYTSEILRIVHAKVSGIKVTNVGFGRAIVTSDYDKTFAGFFRKAGSVLSGKGLVKF